MEGKLTILGSGSAIPTFQNSPAGQILTLCDKSFLIDCGEGVQITMRQMGVHTSRLYNVFISHLHGDHCFGLIGLISTLVKGEDDNPTLGVLLCTETDKTIAKYSVLHDSEQLFASKYMAYMPTEEELQREIEQQKQFFLAQHGKED